MRIVGGSKDRERRENSEQARVLLGHLLKMRDAPVARRRVTEETALDVIVHSAPRHAAHRPRNHRVIALIARKPPLGEQELEYLRLRKLRLVTETAKLLVEVTFKIFEQSRDRCVA